MHIRKTKVVTTEAIYNEDIKIVKGFGYLGLVINANGDSSQEIKRRLKLRRAAMEE